jgi:sugar phosphate isomerase/epimerase
MNQRGWTASRRDFLRAGAAAAACLGAGALPSGAAARRDVPIALQLYSLRDDLGFRTSGKGDLPGTLAAIGKMGFQGVEWFGWGGYFDRTPKELKKMLDDAGLKTCSDHIHADALQGDKFQASLELYQTLGNKIVTLSDFTGLRGDRRTAQYWLDGAKLMNELADKLRPHGIRLGLHNHAQELQKLPDGSLPWELIFDNAAKDTAQQLHMAAWPAAGLDPVAYIKRYPGRTLLMHMNDYAPGRRDVLLGEGEIKWQDVFSAAETVGGVQWYIVEQESYPTTPLESVRGSFTNLKKLLAARK